MWGKSESNAICGQCHWQCHQVCVQHTRSTAPPPLSKLHRKQPPLQPPNPTVWGLTLTPTLSSFPLLSLSCRSPLTFAKVTLSAAAVLIVVTPFPRRELEVRTTCEHTRQHQTGPGLLFLAHARTHARTNKLTAAEGAWWGVCRAAAGQPGHVHVPDMHLCEQHSLPVSHSSPSSFSSSAASSKHHTHEQQAHACVCNYRMSTCDRAGCVRPGRCGRCDTRMLLLMLGANRQSKCRLSSH